MKYPLTDREKRLVERYHNLIYRVMHDYKMCEDQKSDMYDTGALALMCAARNYTTNEKIQHLSFTTVAYSSISSAFSRELKQKKKERFLSLDAETEDGTSFYNSLSNTILEYYNSPKTMQVYEAIKHGLTEKEFEAVLMVSRGFTLYEAADMVGCNRDTFCGRYRRGSLKALKYLPLLEDEVKTG